MGPVSQVHDIHVEVDLSDSCNCCQSCFPKSCISGILPFWKKKKIKKQEVEEKQPEDQVIQDKAQKVLEKK